MTLAELAEECFGAVDIGADGEMNVRCPFCGDEKERLGINVEKGLAHCFRCDWSSGGAALFSALAEEFGIETKQSREKRESHPPKKEDDAPSPVWLPEEYEKFSFAGADDPIEEKAMRYLSSRRVTRKQIDEKRIGYCAVGDFAKRIIFPVFMEGVCVGFTGRDFTGRREPKYRNSEGTKFLYNLPKRKDRRKKLLLVEGPFDALSAERAMPDYDCVARLGSSLADFHLEALRGYEEAVIWPDLDKAGISKLVGDGKKRGVASRIAEIIPVVGVVVPAIGEGDVGSMPEEVAALRFRERIMWSKAAALRLKARLAFS